MASLEQVEKQINSLSVSEIEQLSRDLKAIKKNAKAREEQERAKQFKKIVVIGDSVVYKRVSKTLKGKVQAVFPDGVRLTVPGGKRARNVKWHEIQSKK